ncbi:MAG: phosphatase PAP2 family protein, partial [Lachnospiraceae bacterium]|nr:phosphatase PAP2 family protein [Lachnospiraceae bacterium]
GIEFAIVLGVVYVIMFLLFFRFSPKDSFAVILTPICFLLKIPYVIPMSFGLVGSASSAVSVACGTIVYYVLSYLSKAAVAFEENGETDLLTRLRALLEGIIKYKEMLICAAAFALIVIVVYLVRRMSINYAWTIAMVTGALTGILTILVGDIMYKTDISIVGLILGTLLACVVVKIIQFLVFDVDYSRAEKVQFEDDDYYYYVKAVPKITAGNIRDNADNSDAPKKAKPKKASKAYAKKEVSDEAKREKAAAAAKERKAEPAETVKEEIVEEKVRVVKTSSSQKRTPNRQKMIDVDKEFSKERAAYEARQAEIARRRAAARAREERLRVNLSDDEPTRVVPETSAEEDSELAMSQRMAYQRRKLEERLNRNDE